MDYFEVEEQKQKNALEEKKYQELYTKQAKMIRITMLACFLPIGIIFMLLGAVFSILDTEDGLLGGLIFLSIGALMILVGILMYLVIPKKGNYERYKKSIQRFGGINTYNISIRIGLLEERVKSLEEENKNLKEEVRRLKKFE